MELSNEQKERIRLNRERALELRKRATDQRVREEQLRAEPKRNQLSAEQKRRILINRERALELRRRKIKEQWSKEQKERIQANIIERALEQQPRGKSKEQLTQEHLTPELTPAQRERIRVNRDRALQIRRRKREEKLFETRREIV